MIEIARTRLVRRARRAIVAIAAIAGVGCAAAGGGGSASGSVAPVFPTVAGGCACSAAPAVARRWFDRVLIVVLENEDRAEAADNAYLARLAAQGADFTNFHGLFHPSYSNYLAMVAGKDIPTVYDRQRDLDECTIGDVLETKGLTWKNYAQGYPGRSGECFTGRASGTYARKHVPFMSFKPVQRHACDNIVAAGQFDNDVRNRTLPAYAFYSPDLNNDGHDTGLPYASRWLERFLEPLRADPAFMKGTLIVVTFDESRDSSADAGNRIYTVFLGPMVERKNVSASYSHYNVLRTIEENFGLCPLGGGDSRAEPIVDIWKQTE